MDYIENDPSYSYVLDRWDADFMPAYISCGYGWGGLIKDCHDAIYAVDPKYVVHQIKQKFGGLRFYFSTANTDNVIAIRKTIYDIENRSFNVCEICGKDGELRQKSWPGWIATLCEDHSSPIAGS